MLETVSAENSVPPFFKSQLSPEELAALKMQNEALASGYNLAPMVWQNNLESPLNQPDTSRPPRSPLSGIIHITNMVVKTHPLFETHIEGLLLNDDTLFAIGSLSLHDDRLNTRFEELIQAVNEVLEAVRSPYRL
jgi:hypothetical protein